MTNIIKIRGIIYDAKIFIKNKFGVFELSMSSHQIWLKVEIVLKHQIMLIIYVPYCVF
jgi:hypothetical protein